MSLLQDICGIICAVLTWLLILYAEFVVMMVMLLPGLSTYPVYSYINIFIFQSLAFLAFASHLRTMFTDPVSNRLYYYSKSLGLDTIMLRKSGTFDLRNHSYNIIVLHYKTNVKV